MKSQEQLINEFNLVMIAEGSVIRIQKWESSTEAIGLAQSRYGHEAVFYQICLPNNKFISSFILNTTDEFRAFLTTFFKENGVNSISYNNDGSIFWQTSGA